MDKVDLYRIVVQAKEPEGNVLEAGADPVQVLEMIAKHFKTEELRCSMLGPRCRRKEDRRAAQIEGGVYAHCAASVEAVLGRRV